MKYIEAVCKECKNGFKITFKEEIVPYDISCPLCGGRVRYLKINSSE